MALLSILFVPIFLVLSVVLRRMWEERKANPHRLPLPPGPPPLPFIGNVLDVPKELPWVAYHEMKQKYGDVIHLSFFGQSVLVLMSMEALTDLYDKRSTIYSDRIPFNMVKVIGIDWMFALIRYGDVWRKRRRAFHQHFHMNVVDRYHDVQLQQSRLLVKRLLATPENFFHHTRQALSATIMKITYGIDVDEIDDDYITIGEQVMAGFSAATQVGRYWVEFLPFLRYIPSWFPGARFRKDAEHWRSYVPLMLDKPWDWVKKTFADGNPTPSVAASMIEGLSDGPNREEEEQVARESAGMTYGAGSDTTVSAVNSFIIAMILYPEVQRKAQAELDTVVGPNRLPDFGDRPSLPYIQAVVKEALRWQLVTPTITPRRAAESDIYRGYYIPKGTMIVANAWSICHDPENYSNPHDFIPERFLKDGKLNPEVLDPTLSCFGSGRRICPGRHLAVNSLYSIASSILHAFNITHALDDSGKPIPVRPDMTTGLISFPLPFKCSIKPRSSAAESLIINCKVDE